MASDHFMITQDVEYLWLWQTTVVKIAQRKENVVYQMLKETENQQDFSSIYGFSLD